MKYIIGLILFPTLVLGASNSGTLIIQGVVALVNEITITPTNAPVSITGGATNLLVANVSEVSNDLSGYKIKVSSLNASKLVNGDDSSKKTSYTLSYNGGPAVTLTATPQVVKTVNSLSGLTTNGSDVKVNVVAYPTAPAGTYADTVTISIEAQ